MIVTHHAPDRGAHHGAGEGVLLEAWERRQLALQQGEYAGQRAPDGAVRRARGRPASCVTGPYPRDVQPWDEYERICCDRLRAPPPRLRAMIGAVEDPAGGIDVDHSADRGRVSREIDVELDRVTDRERARGRRGEREG